jgi:hypothetical protein
MTPAQARAKPRGERWVRITFGMVKTHELNHAEARRLALEAKYKGNGFTAPITLCPLDRKKVNEWKENIAKAIKTDAETYLNGQWNSTPEETAGRQLMCR